MTCSGRRRDDWMIRIIFRTHLKLESHRVENSQMKKLTWIQSYFDNVAMKFKINNRTDALKTDVRLFFTTTN